VLLFCKKQKGADLKPQKKWGREKPTSSSNDRVHDIVAKQISLLPNSKHKHVLLTKVSRSGIWIVIISSAEFMEGHEFINGNEGILESMPNPPPTINAAIPDALCNAQSELQYVCTF
jgi:hypothetical protein